MVLLQFQNLQHLEISTMSEIFITKFIKNGEAIKQLKNLQRVALDNYTYNTYIQLLKEAFPNITFEVSKEISNR